MTSEYYNFTIGLIKEAGDLLIKEMAQPLLVSNKENDSRNIITNVDKKINEFLIQQINQNFPTHSINSEEGGDINNNVEYLWALDPIDGTSNFARNIPHFSISICLLKNNIPIVGSVFNPRTNELFSFEKNTGSFLNGKKIFVSNQTDLKKSTIILHTGRTQEVRGWGTGLYNYFLGEAGKTLTLGSSSLDICFIAAGRVEATIYGTLTTMDISCAIGILEEAGGEIIQIDPSEEKFSKKPQKILAVANNGIKQKLLDII